jgi:hypothetical protein
MQYPERKGHAIHSFSQADISALARLSPVGRIESIGISTLLIWCILVACFSSTLLPNLGSVGGYWILIGAALFLERLARPFVVWGLGMLVHRKLSTLAGKAIADDVARIYGAGEVITSAQLYSLIKRRTQEKGLSIGEAN